MRNQCQTFFDPMKRHDKRMQNLPLATGYTTCNHESTGESIQSIFEKYDHTSSPRDSCSAICFLLLVCCRWVGTADIHGMSDIIANLLLNHDRDISTIRYYMWLFYVELGNPGMHLFSHVGLTTTAENVICHAMVKRTGNELGVPSKFPFTVCVCETKIGSMWIARMSGMGLLCISYATTACTRRN
jgi:hypothetical protein